MHSLKQHMSRIGFLRDFVVGLGVVARRLQLCNKLKWGAVATKKREFMPFSVHPKITNCRSQKFCDPRFVICDLMQFVIFVIFTKKLPPIAISVVPMVRPTPRPRSQTITFLCLRSHISIDHTANHHFEPLSLLPSPIMTMPPTQLPPLPLEPSSSRRVPRTTHTNFRRRAAHQPWLARTGVIVSDARQALENKARKTRAGVAGYFNATINHWHHTTKLHSNESKSKNKLAS